MIHTPSPRTSSSANGAARPRLVHGLAKSAEPNPQWRIRDNLLRAERFYDLNSGDIQLLNAMLSVLKGGSRMVYAGNAALSVRALGMSARSISRHAGRLRERGFLNRRDSPNCKRFILRKTEAVEDAYGFDLTPFFERAAEFARRAQDADDQDVMLAALRNRISSLRAQIEARGGDPELLQQLTRSRRWALTPALPGLLADLERQALAALQAPEAPKASDCVQAPCPAAADVTDPAGDKFTSTPSCAEELASNVSQSVRHLQSRNDRVFSLGLPKRIPGNTSTVRPDEMNMSLELVGEDPDPVDVAPRGETCIDDDPEEADTSPEQDQDDGENGPHGSADEPERPGTDVRVTCPLGPSDAPEPGDARLAVADYVQDILAGFRHKLQSQSRPKLHNASSRVVRGQPVSPQAVAERLVEPRLGRPVSNPVPGGLPDLDAVLDACPEGLSLAGERPRSWSQLFEVGWRLGLWIGISEAVLARACAALGRDGFAVTLFGICERLGSIREPAAYLQTLARRPGFRPAELLCPNIGRPGIGS